VKKRRQIGLFVGLGLVIIAAAFIALRPREPVYQGRPLKVWLRAMECRPGWGESVQSAQAREAVLNMGTTAVPYLVKIIHQKGSGLNPGYKKFFYERTRGWPRGLTRHLPVPLDYPYQLQMNAAGALAQIGRPTNVVLLELTALLHREYPPLREVAAQALAKLGDDAIPSLRLSLKDRYPGVQLASANSLWRIREDVTESIPILAQLLGETTNFYDFRWRAARVLGDMGPKAQPAVQALTQALKDPENFVRFNVARALGSIGSGANSAIPALIEALDENNLAPLTRSVDFGGDWQVCAAAAEALGSIGAAPGDVVPGLTQALESSHAETIMAACRSLASFGAKAESAVPALLGLTQHEDSNVRAAALRALIKIAPSAKEPAPATIKLIHTHDSREDTPGLNIRIKAIDTSGKIDTDAAAQAGEK
jgi:HEAT repeat protein